MSLILVVNVLIAFSIIQSIIGVGLLLFGTPTLLLMGYSFYETLSILLPASLSISAFQVFESKQFSRDLKIEFNFYCLPFVMLGLGYILFVNDKINLTIFVAQMLLVSALLRLVGPLNGKISKFINHHRKIYQVFMGLIHGITNMGGGLLTLYSGAVNKNEKEATRALVAYGYLLMGLIQYLLLLYYRPQFLTLEIFIYSAIALASYFIFGKRIYNIIHDRIFYHAVTTIIFIYGFILLMK